MSENGDTGLHGMEGMEARFRGPKGDKGDQGTSHLSFRTAWAILILFVVSVAVGVSAFVGVAIQNARFENKLHHEAQVAHASQIAQDKRTLHVLCNTFDQLAALKPPTQAQVKPGQPFPPSFKYEIQLHDVLRQLGKDIGCP